MVNDPYRSQDITAECERLRARVAELEGKIAGMRPFSDRCFNCGDNNWGWQYIGQSRAYIQPRRGSWFAAPRPAYNKRLCRHCGAEWREMLREATP